LEPRLLETRLSVLRAGLLVVLAVLTARLWHLQIARWARYDRAAQKNRTEIVWTPAPRGTIYDRDSEVLADNQVIYQIQISWEKLPDDDQQFNEAVVTLASVLGVSTVEVEKALEKAREIGTPDVVLPDIGNEIDRIQAIRLDEHRIDMPGIRAVEAQRRHYPHGRLAAHLIGYARAISPDEYDEVRELTYQDPPGDPERSSISATERQPIYFNDSTYGKNGVERLGERLVRVGNRTLPILQGRRGADEFEVDVMRVHRLIRRIPPVRGASVYLTIDRRLQEVAEAALGHPFPNDPARPCDGGAAVLVDVRTGEVLAMASCPAVDLNQWVRGFSPGEWPKIRDDPRKPHLNRAIAGLYPAGSTFKMISASAALEQANINLGTVFNCTGRIHVGVRHDPKTCWKRDGHGWVDFERGIAESCDVFFWQCVLKGGLTADEIASYARDFGLGGPTGCGLPTEEEGRVPTPEWKRQYEDEKWYTGDTINLVIGQGSLTVTPLQMALVTAAVANGGVVPKARVIRKIVWPQQVGVPSASWPTEEPHQTAVKPATLRAVRQGMRAAAAYRNGTAHGPMAGLPFTVAAKTGSAETFPGRKPHSWFVCFAPYESPRYACAVVVEHGGYGSAVAGYVARKILLAASSTSASPVALGEEAADAG
jgi:penicillin-binding protein 2